MSQDAYINDLKRLIQKIRFQASQLLGREDEGSLPICSASEVFHAGKVKKEDTRKIITVE